MDIIRTWFNGIVIASLGTVSIPVILLWALFVPFLDVPGLVVTVKFTNETPAQPEVEVEADEEEEEEEKPADDTIQEEDDVPEEETRTDPNLIETIMTEWNANKAENAEETDKEKDVQQNAEPILSESALKDAMTELYSKKTE